MELILDVDPDARVHAVFDLAVLPWQTSLIRIPDNFLRLSSRLDFEDQSQAVDNREAGKLPEIHHGRIAH